MDDEKRTSNLLDKVFQLLNEEKTSANEAFILAEEIILSAVERMAKDSNLSVEEIQQKLFGQLSQNSQQVKQRVHSGSELSFAKGRGWIGNVGSNENN